MFNMDSYIWYWLDPNLQCRWRDNPFRLYTGRRPHPMDEWTIKTPNPICRLFFIVDLLTDFAALCLTDFIDWRYIHSVVLFSTQVVNCYPHGWRNNTCVLLPVYCTFSLTSPLPKLNVLYCTVHCIFRQCVWLGGGGMLNCAVDHILQ